MIAGPGRTTWRAFGLGVALMVSAMAPLTAQDPTKAAAARRAGVVLGNGEPRDAIAG